MKLLSCLVCLVILSLGRPMLPQHPPQVAVVAATASDRLDLNSATLDQLKSLPGMGEVYARRIIAGRPYTAKNQLVTRGILPQPTYELIQALVVARHPKNK